MTIAALLRLLAEIDAEGGPEAARRNHPRLRNHEGSPMTETAGWHATPPIADDHQEKPESLPVGKLLKWGDEHQDRGIQDQAARARAALAGLRTRHAADQELAAITSEAEQLEKRLAALRAREAELAPAKPKARKVALDYDTAVVRAWAKATGVACPPVGRVPRAVVDAWRAFPAVPETSE